MPCMVEDVGRDVEQDAEENELRTIDEAILLITTNGQRENENTNRLIRRFFPKGTNSDELTKEPAAEAERWVNNYPRKLLGWRSANDLFKEAAKAA